MKSTHKGFTTSILVTIIAVLLIVGGIYAYSTQKSITQVSEPVTAQKDAVPSTDSQTAAVEKSFDEYKSALLAKDGARSTQYANNNTITYYSDLLKSIKFDSKEQVQEKILADKLTILMIRLRYSDEALKLDDGKALFAFAVNKGLISEKSVVSIKTDSIAIDNNTAFLTYKVGDTVSPVKFKFTKEDNMWKLDLAYLIPVANLAFSQSAKQSGYTDDAFLFKILESMGGRAPTEEIWEPLSN